MLLILYELRLSSSSSFITNTWFTEHATFLHWVHYSDLNQFVSRLSLIFITIANADIQSRITASVWRNGLLRSPIIILSHHLQTSVVRTLLGLVRHHFPHIWLPPITDIDKRMINISSLHLHITTQDIFSNDHLKKSEDRASFSFYNAVL